MAPASADPTVSEPTRPPITRLGGAFATGVLVGIAIVLVLLVSADAQDATSRAFALAALVFSLALLGWSASVMAGQGIRSMHEYLDTGSDWTEAKSRRAMLLLCVAGFGGMVGASVIAAVLV